MTNTEPVKMANGGVPRRLTLDLLREMRRLIYQSKGLLPDEIRCALVQRDAYLKLFGDDLHMSMVEATAFDGVPILTDIAGLVPADRMEFVRKGWGVLGVLDDLWLPAPRSAVPIERAKPVCACGDPKCGQPGDTAPVVIDGLTLAQCRDRWEANAAAIESGMARPYALSPEQIAEGKRLHLAAMKAGR